MTKKQKPELCLCGHPKARHDTDGNCQYNWAVEDLVGIGEEIEVCPCNEYRPTTTGKQKEETEWVERLSRDELADAVITLTKRLKQYASGMVKEKVVRECEQLEAENAELKKQLIAKKPKIIADKFMSNQEKFLAKHDIKCWQNEYNPSKYDCDADEVATAIHKLEKYIEELEEELKKITKYTN